MAVTNITTNMVAGVKYTQRTDSSVDWTGVTSGTTFFDLATKKTYHKVNSSKILPVFLDVSEDFTITSGSTLELVTNQLYIDNITTVNLLDNEVNWAGGNYTGSTISGTTQGQKHYNSSYLFDAVHDNVWIRVPRVTMQQVKVALTNTQLTTDLATGIELIPAPGVGKLINLTNATLITYSGTTGETTNPTQPLSIYYTSDNNEQLSIFEPSANWGDFNEIQRYNPSTVTTSIPSLSIINDSIVIQGDVGNFNEFDGTMVVYLTYEILSI